MIVFCGEVPTGPMPAETIDLLQPIRGARFVRGNADRGLVDEFDGKPSESPGPFADWCAKQITRKQREFLASFGSTVRIDSVDGVGRVLFCHAVPSKDIDVRTTETSQQRMAESLAGVDAV